MKISIITATYNSATTLRDTLDSVLAQDYPDFEHIIKDGGSHDDTLEILREYEPMYQGRLKVVSCPDKGIYDAMNQGIEATTGEVVGILNSDDMYYSDKILSEVASGISEVEAVYGDLDFVDPHDTSKVVRRWKGSQYFPGAFFTGWHPAHPTFYVRRKNFERYGNFDTSLDVSSDFELMLRFLEKEKISTRYLPITFIKMRTGGESTGSLSKIIKGNRNILRAFKKNGFKVPHFYIIRRLAPKALNIIKNKFHR